RARARRPCGRRRDRTRPPSPSGSRRRPARPRRARVDSSCAPRRPAPRSRHGCAGRTRRSGPLTWPRKMGEACGPAKPEPSPLPAAEMDSEPRRPPLEVPVTPGTLDRALALVRLLRASCPWDAEQTATSLVPHLLEETHEVVDAIHSGEAQALEGELGDL